MGTNVKGKNRYYYLLLLYIFLFSTHLNIMHSFFYPYSGYFNIFMESNNKNLVYTLGRTL